MNSPDFQIRVQDFMKKDIFLIIAGEPSGDRHAALLVEQLKSHYSSLEVYGIGGEEMATAGVSLLYRMEQLAFLGLAEIFRHLPFIRKVQNSLLNWIKSEEPRAVILVDYPGFNLRFARMVNKLGIPVIYYICPQLWAWGQHRVKKIKKYVDLLLVIFKFEENFYARFGITARFVGHPLVEEISANNNRATFCKQHSLDSDKQILALLPGSRLNEVKKILPELVKVAEMNQEEQDFQWVVGKTDSLPIEIYQEIIKKNRFIKIVERDTHSLMKHAHLAMVASGTATLETGFLETPMIVLYKVASFTYLIGKNLVKIGNISLVNIVLQQNVVPELIQNQVRARQIDLELKKYLDAPEYYKKVKQELKAIKDILGPPGASARAAQEIWEFLK
jgi:lipid-A-disaccharide synthase